MWKQRTMTAPSREPTEAMRETARTAIRRGAPSEQPMQACSCFADDSVPLWTRTRCKSGACEDTVEYIARALMEQDAAARREGFEQAIEAAAKWHDMRASMLRCQEDCCHDLVARGYNAGADASGYRRMAEHHETSAEGIRALTPDAASEKP